MKRLKITVELCGDGAPTSHLSSMPSSTLLYSFSSKSSMLVAVVEAVPHLHCHFDFGRWPTRHHLGHSAGHHRRHRRRNLKTQPVSLSVFDSCNRSYHGHLD